MGRVSTFNWTYDALNRLASESYDSYDDSADYVATYTFDLVGNRLSKATDAGANGSIDAAVTYTYDSNDRLLTEADDEGGSGDTFTRYGYGASGKWTKQTGKTVRAGLDDSGTVVSDTAYGYDVQGRMSQATVTQGGQTSLSTYAYGDDGIRVSQSVTDGGTTTATDYLIDGSNPTGLPQTLEEHVGGAVNRTYTWGLDLIAQQDTANGVLTFVHDGRASTRALLDDSGEVVQRFAPDAYGNAIAATGLTPVDTAFTSQLFGGGERDVVTGLNYNDARYYACPQGIFTSTDPADPDLQRPITLHPSLYAGDNPVMFGDPAGEFFDIVSLVTCTTIQATMMTMTATNVTQGVMQARRTVLGLDAAAEYAQALWQVDFIPLEDKLLMHRELAATALEMTAQLIAQGLSVTSDVVMSMGMQFTMKATLAVIGDGVQAIAPAIGAIVNGHHVLPKYLGGNAVQDPLVGMGIGLHIAYHRGLNQVLPTNRFKGLGRGFQNWYWRNFAGDYEKKLMLKKLVDYSARFERENGVKLTERLFEEIRNTPAFSHLWPL